VQIGIGRRNHPNIESPRHRLTDSSNASILEDPNERHLNLLRGFADII
jgi:hypothetical protein